MSKKVDIQPSIAPHQKTVFLSLHWTKIIPRGPGFWKFNNAFLEDNNYVEQMRHKYSEFREKHKYIQDKRMYWELLKMEIRCFTISFAKAKETRKRELIRTKWIDLTILSVAVLILCLSTKS